MGLPLCFIKQVLAKTTKTLENHGAAFIKHYKQYKTLIKHNKHYNTILKPYKKHKKKKNTIKNTIKRKTINTL